MLEERPISDFWFQKFLTEEKLMGCKCTDCGALFIPPRQVCVGCSSLRLEWHQMQGTGKLAAFTSIAMVPPSMEKEGYGRERPYCTGVVELEGGLRVVARIEEVNSNQPENIRPGMSLKVCFLHRESDVGKTTWLAFVPSGDTPTP
ncbi:MAG: OB-fold domain-containing protein [Planctomycetota bacterium]|nr:OB-fold domain-containing protein [Planctomycetota bacterium]MDA1142076.1 OB-fold domain-containing protein [Planctomycetota bacterium]